MSNAKEIPSGALRSAGAAAPARDGEIAIREEFDLAVKRGTREALELFIRRHPDHALAGEAARLLEGMTSALPGRTNGKDDHR